MHTLIIGQSFVGKSALGKQIGTCLRAKGQTVLAYNPTLEHGYTKKDSFDCQAAQFESDDPDKFVAEIYRLRESGTKKIFLIIDEAHEFFTRADCKYLWIGTKGRHYGLYVIAITQRAALISPTFRGQCSNIYIFRSNRTDMDFITNEFWYHELDKKNMNLPKGEFIKIGENGISRGNINEW